jgi:hypothetical protein
VAALTIIPKNQKQQMLSKKDKQAMYADYSPTCINHQHMPTFVFKKKKAKQSYPIAGLGGL